MDFDNLHQVLRNLYQEMMPLCGDMIGVAKGIAGLGALFYVAYRRDKKPSIRKLLSTLKDKAAALNAQRDKVKKKDREVSL